MWVASSETPSLISSTSMHWLRQLVELNNARSTVCIISSHLAPIRRRDASRPDFSVIFCFFGFCYSLFSHSEFPFQSPAADALFLSSSSPFVCTTSYERMWEFFSANFSVFRRSVFALKEWKDKEFSFRLMCCHRRVAPLPRRRRCRDTLMSFATT